MAKTFEVRYQAPGGQSGLATVEMKVYKADDTLDTAQSIPLTEIGTTGRYKGSFVADAPNWSVHISDGSGGKVVKLFDKPIWDSHGIADLIGNLVDAVDVIAGGISTVLTQVGNLSSPAMLG